MRKILFFFLLLSFGVVHGQPIKAVIFDFGGVVATFDRSLITHFLMDSFPVSEAEAEKLMESWYAHIYKGENEESFWNQFACSVGSTLQPGWLAQFQNVQIQSLRPFPATLATVERLKGQGYRVGLLSNVTAQHAKIIQKLGLYDLFDPLVLSCDIAVKKPHAEAYKILLERLSLPADEVLFIDDQKVNVDAAEKQGIQGIHLLRPACLDRELEAAGIR